MRELPLILLLLVKAFTSGVLHAESPPDGFDLQKQLQQADAWPGVIRSNLGVTRKGTRIPCLYAEESLDVHSPKLRILLVAGFQDQTGTRETLQMLEWFSTSEEAKPFRDRFTLSAVPIVNPNGNSAPQFPPQGEAYSSKDNPEAEYVWRWIGMHAPDLVVCLTSGKQPAWWTPQTQNASLTKLAQALGKPANGKSDDDSEMRLATSLMKSAPANTGTIPALSAVSPQEGSRPEKLLQELFQAIEQAPFQGPSPARKELQKRVDREPVEIAQQLAKVYGHDLSSVQYIPALALVGRLWLGELTNDPTHRVDVERIVAPYLSEKKTALPQRFSGSHLAGHLIFAELARTTKDQEKAKQYLDLARRAAETGFDAQGEMKPAMPAHSEMSDAVFMSCPILVEAGVQTGEKKYLDMAARHFDFMRELVLRDDGIYRHSPLCETAWGRGNGFPALGLAWSLSLLDENDPLFKKFLNEFQTHMASLVKHQDPTGLWRQVVDDSGSYRELTSTCMITFALIRGVRNGWLKEETYRPVIDKAFNALKTRIAEDGTLVDVCTGTGKQKSLRDYYDRKAILGRDARGGAMALLVTTEMARWRRDSK